MNWMNLTDRYFRYLWLAAIVIFITQPVILAQSQEGPFDELKQRFEQGEVFNAAFNHEYIDSYTDETSESRGEIWVDKNQYKVNSENQVVLVDGEISRVYDEHRNREIISEYEPEEDDFAPSRFLQGADSSYTVSSEERTGGEVRIELDSDDPFALFKSVEIILTDDLIPLRIEAIDQSDNQIITRFNEGRFIEADADIFKLDRPDNAEVVDMRN